MGVTGSCSAEELASSSAATPPVMIGGRQGCGAVTFFVGSGSGSGSGETFRLRLWFRLRVKLYGDSGSGSDSGQNVPAPAAPAPMIKSSYEP